MLEMTINDRRIEQLFEGLAPARVNTAGARALNRGINSANTVMVRAVANDLGLKQSEVKDQVRVYEARPDRLEATLAPSRKRLALTKFKVTGPFPSRGRGAGVRYRIGSRSGRIPDGFIAQMRSGHRGVFVRVEPGQRSSVGAWSRNLPIREVKGPSIAKVFQFYRYIGAQRGLAQLRKDLVHELKYAATRA